MAREIDDWVQGYIEYTSEHEAPEKYHLWVAFALLSAALRRKVWMSRGFYLLYPNIFVLLVGESARTRKSAAIDIGVALLKDGAPDVCFIAGRCTPEGLVRHLNRMTVTQDDHGGSIKHDSHVFVHADELATLFGYEKQQASRMAILLTQMYGAQDTYDHLTAGEGMVQIYNTYPTLLAATDPRNLKVLPEEAVGGLLGRLVIVSAAKKRHVKAWPEPTPEAVVMRTRLLRDLEYINKLDGVFTITPEARELFTAWYSALDQKETIDARTDAFQARCHDTALKIAMLASVAQGDSLVLTEKHVALGVSVIEAQLPEISRVLSWTGTSTHAQNRAKFLDILRRAGGVAPRRRMLRAMGVAHDEFDQLETTLLQEGEIQKSTTAQDVFYRLLQEV